MTGGVVGAGSCGSVCGADPHTTGPRGCSDHCAGSGGGNGEPGGNAGGSEVSYNAGAAGVVSTGADSGVGATAPGASAASVMSAAPPGAGVAHSGSGTPGRIATATLLMSSGCGAVPRAGGTAAGSGSDAGAK